MTTQNPQQQSSNRKASRLNTGITLKSIVSFAVAKWYWFILSLAITMGAGAFYLMKTTPLYTRTASLLIKDGDSKNGSYDTSIDMSEFGIGKNRTNLENEIRVLKSPNLMKQVVLRLNLNDVYTYKDGLRNKELYKQSPVLFEVIDSAETSELSFDFTLSPEQKIEIRDIALNGNLSDTTLQKEWGDTVSLRDIKFCIVKPEYDENYVGRKIRFVHKPLNTVAKLFAGSIWAVKSADKSSIIDISITCPSVAEADDVLTTLIQVYNEHWIEDKNQIAVSTSRFIGERLAIIEKELGNVESDISAYKSEHLMPSVEATAALYMTQSSEAQAAVADLNNQISMAEMLRQQLSGDSFDQTLPSNTGIINADIQSSINQYNSIVLERNRLLETTSDFNPVVKDRTQALRTLRDNIVQSVNSYIAALRTQLTNAQRMATVSTNRLAANPSQAKYLLSVERQQKVKESLYLFLLQKREENELTQAFTAYNTSMVEEPSGSGAPTFPKKKNIIFMAFVLGLAFPLGIFILRETLDTKIRGKQDLAALQMPYLGEIPAAETKRRGLARLKKREPQERRIVVQEKSRDAINEAFRVLRTNLEYMGSDSDAAGCKIISITSANPGSGKTFVSVNLAKVLALKGNKVLMIDLDIRKGSLSKILGPKDRGVVDFLVGKAGIGDILRKGIDGTDTLDAIGIGSVPPNPSELLAGKNLDVLVNDLKSKYDFIILDCPPVEIVTDARVINRLVDMTVFVIRAGLLEKDELPTVQEYYDSARYRNMAILLNDTDVHSGYGYHRYGYHYGYGRNYGYGYGNY